MFFVEPLSPVLTIIKKLPWFEDPTAAPASTEKVLRQAVEDTRQIRLSQRVDRRSATPPVWRVRSRLPCSTERGRIQAVRDHLADEVPPSWQSHQPEAH